MKDVLTMALEALKSCNTWHITDGSRQWYDERLVDKALTAIDEALAQEPFEYWNAVEGWVKIDEVRDHMDSVGCGTIYKTAGEDRVPLCIAQPPVAKPHEQETVAVYGYCPKCGAKGVQRERRPNGNDKCVNGHTYPSSKASLAQPQQETKEYVAGFNDGLIGASELRTLGEKIAQPQQEPVAISLNTGTKQGVKWLKNVEHGESLYTYPPQRPWAGLTIEDKKEYVAQDFGGSRLDAMDWAEKRLKEKNT